MLKKKQKEKLAGRGLREGWQRVGKEQRPRLSPLGDGDVTREWVRHRTGSDISKVFELSRTAKPSGIVARHREGREKGAEVENSGGVFKRCLFEFCCCWKVGPWTHSPNWMAHKHQLMYSRAMPNQRGRAAPCVCLSPELASHTEEILARKVEPMSERWDESVTGS